MSSLHLILGSYVHRYGTPLYSVCYTLPCKVVVNDSAQACFTTAAVIAFASDHSEAPRSLALGCKNPRKQGNPAGSTTPQDSVCLKHVKHHSYMVGHGTDYFSCVAFAQLSPSEVHCPHPKAVICQMDIRHWPMHVLYLKCLPAFTS